MTESVITPEEQEKLDYENRNCFNSLACYAMRSNFPECPRCHWYGMANTELAEGDDVLNEKAHNLRHVLNGNIPIPPYLTIEERRKQMEEETNQRQALLNSLQSDI